MFSDLEGMSSSEEEGWNAALLGNGSGSARNLSDVWDSSDDDIRGLSVDEEQAEEEGSFEDEGAEDVDRDEFGRLLVEEATQEELVEKDDGVRVVLGWERVVDTLFVVVVAVTSFLP